MTTQRPLHGRSPRPIQLDYFLWLFVRLRWVAAGSTAAVLAFCQFILGFDLPYSELYQVVVAIVLYNAAFRVFIKKNKQYKPTEECLPAHHRRSLRLALQQTFLDQLALFLLLHFAGGLENPFVLLFLLHVVLAGLLYEPFAVAAAATSASLAIFALGILEHLGVLHHYHVYDLLGDMEAVDSWMFVLVLPGSLTLVMVVLTMFMVMVMNEWSRRRDLILELVKDRERQNFKLMRVDQLRRGLLAVATHDLKAPLAAVSSYLQTISAGYVGPINDKQQEIIDRCLTRLAGLSKFIADILSLTAVERGEIRENLRFADFAPLVAQTVDNFRGRAQEKNQQLQLTVEDNLPQVLIAPERMMQVLENLVSNAIKYTPNEKSIQVSIESSDEWLILRIVDQGIGISEEDQAKLFQDFFRASSVRKEYEGTGLGLSMARRIVAAHGGKVEVASEYGKGSTFTVLLPRDSRAQRRDSKVSILPGFDAT